MAVAFYNLKTTYTTIMENIEVFGLLLEDSEESCGTSKNLFFLDSYNDILEKHLDALPIQRGEDRTRVAKISECLSFDHLLSKNIIHSGEKQHGKTTFSITKHLLEIIKDVYKEKAEPLNKTQYLDFITLIKKYRDIFERTIHSKTSKETAEQKHSFEALLEEIYGKILSSISSLEYETQNAFSKKPATEMDNIDAEKLKLKQARHLQERFISPLYTFVNKRTSEFMTNLNAMRDLFEQNNKHFALLQTVDHYYLQYLFIVKKVKPIKNYIHAYVRQSEINLHRNIGNEKLFNQINTFIGEYSIGHSRKTKIWTFDAKRLAKMCYFYQNKSENYRDFNVKTHKVDRYFLERVSQHVKEQVLEGSIELETKILVNREYEKIMLANKEKTRRAETNRAMLSLFDSHTKKTKPKEGEDVVAFIMDFLNSNEELKNNWSAGQLEFLTKNFVAKNEADIRLKEEFAAIQKGDVKVEYQKIIWRREND